MYFYGHAPNWSMVLLGRLVESLGGFFEVIHQTNCMSKKFESFMSFYIKSEHYPVSRNFSQIRHFQSTLWQSWHIAAIAENIDSVEHWHFRHLQQIQFLPELLTGYRSCNDRLQGNHHIVLQQTHYLPYVCIKNV